MRRRLAVTFGIAALCTAPVVQACGPYFPNAYFVFGHERNVAVMPPGLLYYELYRVLGLTPLDPPDFPPDRTSAFEVTLQTDGNDLVQALAVNTADSGARTAIVERYMERRRSAREADEFDQLSTEVPREFLLYSQGAFLYHADDVVSAIAKWKELLDLPPDERKWRSVWAAYMIGRALVDSDPAQAVPFFEQTRALANDGFHDSLDLAYNSLGWQAYAHNALGDPVAAMHRYVDQFLAAPQRGRSGDLSSIRMLCAGTVRDAESLQKLVRDPLCRRIVCAWVACSVNHSFRNAHSEWDRWLEVMSDLGEPDLPEAEYLAWAAYQHGDLETARKWLNMVAEPSPYGRWTRAKLMLREGNIDEAVEVLRSLVDAFPESDRLFDTMSYEVLAPKATVKAELAVLLVGRQEYVNALDLLMRSGYWLDAAYIAERVLTVSELESYILTHGNDPALATPLEEGYWYTSAFGKGDGEEGVKPMSRLDSLTYVLARRLARNGQWPRADVFFPRDVREIAAQFTKHVNAGSSPIEPTGGPTIWDRLLGTRAKRAVDLPRAEQLRRAATIMRENGMELVGTELEPDWRVWDGVFSLSGASGYRLSESPEEVYFEVNGPELPEALMAAISASEDEKRRAAINVPNPDQRFHYRWKAADLMWECAYYLPNDNVETMRVLWQGGVWIKNRDPHSADRFYKALVWRNWNMPYAQRADKLRWFPVEPPE